MVGESLAIVVVIVVMAAMYKHADKGQIAALALPLICVPCGRLLSAVVLSSGKMDTLAGYIFVVAGLMASVALCTLLSMRMRGRRARLVYLVFSFIFSGALSIAYLL